MQHSPNEVKEKLLRALDKDNNVVNMVAVIEVIAILEKIPITKDELEKTRLGKYVNELRKKTTNENLAKRAKDLVRKWRRLILPQDGTLNGERNVSSHSGGSTIVSPAAISVSSHLPGPGPGHGSSSSSSLGIGGFKPATSPAAATTALIGNHQQRGVKSGVVVVVSSPGYSQCSSASTSPSVASGRPGNGRPDTPSSFSFSRHSSANHIGNFHGFKPVSPATVSMGRMMTTTPSSSSTRLYPHPPPRSPATSSDIVLRRSPSCSVAKRFRASDNDDSCDSLGGKTRCRAANYQNNVISPCPIAVTATTTNMVNGIVDGGGNGDSMDSVQCRSSSETGYEEELPLTTTTTEPNVSKESSSSGMRNPRKNSRSKKEKADILKEKLASHGRTPKVKTTAELIQELKARNSGMAESVAAAAGSNARVPSLEMDHHLAVTRRAVYSSLLGTVEDVTRNKTQLMEKFLNDSMDGSDTTNVRDGGESSSLPDYDPCTESVNAILRTLPPIDLDAIKWDDDDREVVSSPLDPSTDATKSETIDEETIKRLQDTSWEGVNGNYNQDEQFVRWNEPLTRRTYENDLLHIWPYVDID